MLMYLFLSPDPDRDCVAHRPSTLRLFFDVDIDFTGLLFLSNPAAWRDGRHPRGRSLRRRLVRTSIFADLSSLPPIGTPSPTLTTVVSPHATRSGQPTCVIHPAPVTSVLVERVPSPSMKGCRCIASSSSSSATRGLLRCCLLPLTTSTTSSSTTRRCAPYAYGLHQVVRVLRRLLRVSPSHRLDRPALRWKTRAPTRFLQHNHR